MSTTTRYNTEQQPARSCVVNGLVCFYAACTTDVCACHAQEECLCVKRSMCCDGRSDTLTIGLDTTSLYHADRAYCKTGLGFCECALIPPRTLCASASHVLCLQSAGALPLHEDYLDDAICAYYCLQCYPTCDCAAQAPRCPALERMERGGGGMETTHHVVQAVAMDERDDYEEDITSPDNDMFHDEVVPMAEAQMVQILPVNNNGTPTTTAPYEDDPSSTSNPHKNM